MLSQKRDTKPSSGLTPKTSRDSIRALRKRLRANGRVLVSTDLPGDLIEQIDHEKQLKGVRGRTPIIEEALRFYFEKQQGHK